VELPAYTCGSVAVNNGYFLDFPSPHLDRSERYRELQGAAAF
jgi:hypothetical protein